MQETKAVGKVIAAGECRKLDVVGDKVEIRVTGADTRGACSMIVEATPPLGGPPPHVHHREDEIFHVLEGEFEFSIAGRKVLAKPGATVLGPRGIAHTFKNIGSSEGRMLVVISPPGFERFFEEVHDLSQRAPPAPEQIAALAKRYELELLPPA